MEQFQKALIAFAETKKTAPPEEFLKALQAMNPVLEGVAFSLQEKFNRVPQDTYLAGTHESVLKENLDNLSKLGKSMSRSKAPDLKTLGMVILGVVAVSFTVFAFIADAIIVAGSEGKVGPIVTPALWALPVNIGSSSSSKSHHKAQVQQPVLKDSSLRGVVNTVAKKAGKVEKTPEGKVKQKPPADNSDSPRGP
jgi:hypothetical protein